MDYEGLCEDLLEIARRAGFFAARSLITDQAKSVRLLWLAAECHDFRQGLFLRGYGYGGY